MSVAESPKKKTIYVDVDDEITAIIDKVKTAGEPIQALVLPKRATMLQSIVNMKLLKRAADQDNKSKQELPDHIVLRPCNKRWVSPRLRIAAGHTPWRVWRPYSGT